MKPGKATIQTMIAHVLSFETSKRTDSRRNFLLEQLQAMDGPNAVRPMVRDLLVRHRELRRAARRLAKMVARSLELAPLAARMAVGRAKYPAGCTVLSLMDEAGEFAHAINKDEGIERVRDELLDVAAVAMRLYLGEVDEVALHGLSEIGRRRMQWIRL